MPNLSVIDGSISTWMVGARAVALHWRACLRIFHKSFASFGDIWVVCFAEVKYHVA